MGVQGVATVLIILSYSILSKSYISEGQLIKRKCKERFKKQKERLE